MARNRIFRCTNVFGFLSFVLLVTWQVSAQARSDVQLHQNHSTTEPLTGVSASQIQPPKNHSIDQALVRERIHQIMLETVKAGETVIMIAGQNPTNSSWWMVQVRPTNDAAKKKLRYRITVLTEIPGFPTAVATC